MGVYTHAGQMMPTKTTNEKNATPQKQRHTFALEHTLLCSIRGYNTHNAALQHATQQNTTNDTNDTPHQRER